MYARGGDYRGPRRRRPHTNGNPRGFSKPVPKPITNGLGSAKRRAHRGTFGYFEPGTVSHGFRQHDPRAPALGLTRSPRLNPSRHGNILLCGMRRSGLGAATRLPVLAPATVIGISGGPAAAIAAAPTRFPSSRADKKGRGPKTEVLGPLRQAYAFAGFFRAARFFAGFAAFFFGSGFDQYSDTIESATFDTAPRASRA